MTAPVSLTLGRLLAHDSSDLAWNRVIYSILWPRPPLVDSNLCLAFPRNALIGIAVHQLRDNNRHSQLGDKWGNQWRSIRVYLNTRFDCQRNEALNGHNVQLIHFS